MAPYPDWMQRTCWSHSQWDPFSSGAQTCCRHFMVKLLDDGSFVIPGEESTHASLDALVTFHQQQPMRPHGELLKQPCQQEDPENVDYEDLFLYYNTLAEEAASLSPGPSEHQNTSFHPVAAPKKASATPVLFHQLKERKPSEQMDRVPLEEAASFCPQRAPLEEACQKLWRNLKILPQTGKKVQQKLKSHLEARSLSPLQDSELSKVTHSSGARAHSVVCHSSGARAHSMVWDNNRYTDPFVSTSLASSSQPQAPRDRDNSSKEASRSASWSEVTSRTRGWHQAIVRALSSQVSKQESKVLVEPQEDCLPEEYHPPPPFAPGYC
ncbi:hematopoietic SH2 domain-containing protein isoform 2-T4 [Rhynchonycteris naso]